MKEEAFLIVITGLVQGVGFRPFVYRLAKQIGVKGTISNTMAGVYIHAEGEAERVNIFVQQLKEKNPPLAEVKSFDASPTSVTGFDDFTIISSEEGGESTLTVSPDVALCQDCLSELNDPRDMRYRYPFINCVNCGPRFSIIEDLPYDRPLTSMASFRFCDACHREYTDPMDRRYHAQPIACPQCGPHVSLIDPACPDNDCQGWKALEVLSDMLHQGKIIAMKGLGGYHLACNAADSEAVDLLRIRKGRPDKPFALMVKDCQSVRQVAHLGPIEEKLLTSARSPILLLKKVVNSFIAENVAPRNGRLGIMLPYTPLHRLIFQSSPSFLIMTSGNRSGLPITYRDDDVVDNLGDIADVFLMHNRRIVNQCDDSVAMVHKNTIYLYRCGRGEAPHDFSILTKTIPMFACGAEQKSAIALATGTRFILGQYLGDLKSAEAFDAYRQAAFRMLRLYRSDPEIVVHDMHPDYLSTQFAHEFGSVRLCGVQHHHAHIAACLMENRCFSRVLGFSLDGTGYGDDGTVWGGEILLASIKNYQRVGRCSLLLMPGGERAIKQPWRMVHSYLHSVSPHSSEGEMGTLFPLVPKEKIHAVQTILDNQSGPKTSSMGRLFDIAGSLLLGQKDVSYEGQSAMELQWLAESWSEEEKPFPLSIEMSDGFHQIFPTFFIGPLFEGLREKEPPAKLAYRFHRTVVEWILQESMHFREKSGIHTIVLSGGVFQNHLLLSMSRKMLEKQGFSVLIHSRIPCNDGGIAFGQLAVACAQEGILNVEE